MVTHPTIVLFTDFGLTGPYTGQVQSVIARQSPIIPVINLFADAPRFSPDLSAYLLAAYVDEFEEDSVFLCVVDPGVGGERKPLAVKVDGRWFVGPDNGLFDVVAKRGDEVEWWEITWRPEELSSSFHGRDLFAPVAASLAMGALPQGVKKNPPASINDVADDLHKIIYIDNYGNAMTGINARHLNKSATVMVDDISFSHAATFSDVAVGEGFWYENANGLIELAVNQGSAEKKYKLSLGDAVTLSQN